MKAEMYRQGDILLIKRNGFEELDYKESISEKSDILIEGTLTGHHHRVINGSIWKQEINSQGVFAYVLAKKNCVLIHDEHEPINLPEGIYEVRRQREVSGYVDD